MATSSDESNDSYKHMESPANVHAINMDFSAMESAPSASQRHLFGSGSEKKLYGHDLVMIFPRREGGELKKPENFTIDAFVALLTGKDRHKSKRSGKIVIDPFARVLRTSRCYLDDMGRDLVMNEKEHENDHSERAEQRRLLTEERILEGEYEKVIGSRQATTESLFCELVAMAIARRVQLACGLTTRLFRSVDNDEILMTIKADDGDLRIEADRTNYRLQVSNKPFDMWAHGDKNHMVRQEIGDVEWSKSIEHLRHTRGSPHEDSEFPEMDPLLMTRGDEYHPNLSKALKVWGHTEEADGQYVPDEKARAYKGGRMERFWTSLFGMAYDPMTYFSAFADYRHEDMYQPYYRRYPIKWGDRKEETLFSQKDRIRLASGIVTRHINTDALQVAEYLTSEMFALHDPAALDELRQTWALRWLMLNQPLNKIRFYFGEKVALYFAWLGFYTKMLIFPSIAGIITYAVVQTQNIQRGEDQGYILIAFALFVVIWSSIFAEVWKRKNGLFNSLWGLHGFHRAFRYRAQFRGTISYNPVTDAEEMTYESRAKRRRAFLISIVVVLMMVGIVIVALVALFLLKHIINDTNKLKAYKLSNPDYRKTLTMGVTGLNAVQILILNTVYRGVAKKLNDLENHRTDREYENHLVIKVFLFQFCNSFASFFYIGFVKKPVEGHCLLDSNGESNCMGELQDQLLVLFLIRIIVGNTLEVVVPYLKYQFQLYRERKGLDDKVSHNYIEEQAKLMPYEHNEAFEDYNEMVIQYGFITLFVVAFPLTPLLALANNIAEVHVDSVKLCYVHRRPFPHPAKSIGAWFYILRFMSYVALATNSALILWTSDLFADTDNSDKAFMFVVSCQVCLMVAFLIERVIPDVPGQLKLLMNRHTNIVDTVFKGMDEGDDSSLYEIAEALDLTIHANEHWDDKHSV
ncbi:Anoctamin-like protein, partial [Globisporangium splendens]